MTYEIDRHDISQESYPSHIVDFPEERESYVKWLVESPHSAGAPLRGLKHQAKLSLAMDTDADLLETWEAWTTWMQAGEAALAASTASPGSQVIRRINRKERILTAVEPDYFTNATNWLDAFYLAVICREQERYRFLCQIPVEILQEAGESRGSEYNSYMYHWIRTLQAFVLNKPGLVDHLLSAMELSDPRVAGVGNSEALNKLVFPPLNTFLHLVQRDSNQFNEALAQGLELFRDFHTSTPERAEDIDGGAPLGLLALACLAYDTAEIDPEFSFDVESGYLPKNILNREWYAEFPT